jgi:hypothetical protein
VSRHGQLLSEGVDPIESSGFVESVFITKVKPRVVMQERLIWAGALTLYITKKGSAELAGA